MRLIRAIAVSFALVLTGCAMPGAPAATESPAPTSTVTAAPTTTPSPTTDPGPGVPLPDPAAFVQMDPALFAVNTLVDPPWGSWDTVDVNFGSPSGNIGCGILGPENGDLWGCAINEKDWDFPRDAPEDYCYDAQVPCGGGIEVDGSGLPHPRYRGDGGYPGAFVTYGSAVPIRTLEYGQSVTFGDVTCFSETAAITCVNTASGHGFVIARDRNDIF
jgi:hypothetical protein